MTMKLSLHHGTIIIAYGSSISYAYAPKEVLFVISAVYATEKLIILRDFNASVGQNNASWDGVLRKHRTGKSSSYGLLLLQTWAKHNLFITNIVFHLPAHTKTSLMHSRVWCRNWTDNHLIISKLSISVQPKKISQGKKKKKTLKRLNITKLKDFPTKQLFVEAFDERFYNILFDKQDEEVAWIILRDTADSTAVECLGPSTSKCRLGWCDPYGDNGPHREETRSATDAPPRPSVYY